MDHLTVSKVNSDLYMVSDGHLSRRYLNLEQILNELYDDKDYDLYNVIDRLEKIEKRLERIENFCNSLADSIAPLEAFR